MKHSFTKNHLPVFPLNTVVFVGGILHLQIFEQRYLNLVKTCMKNQHGFVSVLIHHGKEVDDIPKTYSIGTYVEIIDWDKLENNMLSIIIQGQQRVSINSRSVHDDNLISADITYINNLTTHAPDVIDVDLLDILHALQKHPFVSNKYPEIDENSLADIAYKLGELLPFSNLEKQNLLEANQLRLLLDQLKATITRLES